jgi:hypothetical protein
MAYINMGGRQPYPVFDNSCNILVFRVSENKKEDFSRPPQN